MTIYCYTKLRSELSKQKYMPLDGIEHIDNPDLIWLDLYKASIEEEKAVETKFNIEIISETEKIGREDSARYYVEDNKLYLNVKVPSRIGAVQYDKNTKNFVYQRANLTIILAENILITHHDFALTALEVGFDRSSVNLVGTKAPKEVLLDILESIIERQADIHEKLGISLDNASIPVLSAKRIIKAENRLKELGRIGALLGLSRDCLHDIERLINFLLFKMANLNFDKKRLSVAIEDLKALQHLNEAQTSDLSFLLDGTLGLATVRQTQSLNLMAVVTLLFAPPTLIASVFGMNFSQWEFFGHVNGHLIAFAFMGISSIIVLLIAKIAKLF